MSSAASRSAEAIAMLDLVSGGRAEFGIEFDSSEQFEFNVVENVENLLEGFNLARGVDVPAGEYKYTAIESSLSIGQQRRVSGSVDFEAGQFYGGTRLSLGFSGARVKLHPQFAVEPSVSVNRVELPFGDFTAKHIGRPLAVVLDLD